MVLGTISYGSRSLLVFLGRNMSAHSVFQTFATSLATLFFNNPHTATVTARFCRDSQVFQWSVRSPSLMIGSIS